MTQTTDKTKLDISLPKHDYMSQKNTYCGSQGRFRYHVSPKEEGEETVLCAAVYLDNCLEVEDEAGRVTRRNFAFSNEGIAEAQEWISAEFTSRFPNGTER